ncbi:MAG: tetratricopeptide repeat protein [Candidatus Rokubacteria bacterium]|nr:tetratricopeptide repeat protein [Candidatus Rokubacteria bacterium]
MIPALALGALALVVAAIVGAVWAVRRARRSRAEDALRRLVGELGGVVSGSRGTAAHEGATFSCGFEPAGRPERFAVTLAGAGPAFVLRRRTALDRALVAVGLARPRQTGEADFDAAMYLETASDDPVASLAGSPARRDAARALLALGVTLIRQDGEKLGAVWYADGDPKPPPAETIQAVVAQLRRLVTGEGPFTELVPRVADRRRILHVGGTYRAVPARATRFTRGALRRAAATGLTRRIAFMVGSGIALALVAYALHARITARVVPDGPQASGPLAPAVSRRDRVEPDTARAYSERGRSHLVAGRYREAAADFRRAIDLDPLFTAAYKQLDDALTPSGDWDTIITYWTRLIELKPDHAEAYFERGGARSRKRDVAGALADAAEACRLGLRRACDTYERYRRATESAPR